MPVSVLQWNIWYAEKRQNILRQLRRTPADVICLQELTRESSFNPGVDVPAFLAEELGLNLYYEDAHTIDTNEWRIIQGNAILTRFPIRQKSAAFVQEPSGPRVNVDTQGRLYLEVTVDTPEGTLTVGSAHLSYTNRFKETRAKSRETDRLMKQITRHDGRYIFTGDLNALPDSRTVTALSKRLSHTGPPFEQATWTTKPFQYGDFVANSLTWRMDYVFHTPDLTVSEVEILETEYSDHLPIRAEFALPAS